MRMQARTLLAALAFALPTLAQTQATERKEAGPSEKLWKIEASGIGG